MTLDVGNGVELTVKGQETPHPPAYVLQLRGGYELRPARWLALAPELGLDVVDLRTDVGTTTTYPGETRPEVRVRVLGGFRLSLRSGRLEWFLRAHLGWEYAEERTLTGSSPRVSASFIIQTGSALVVEPETGLLVRVWRHLHVGATVGLSYEVTRLLFLGQRLDVAVSGVIAIRPPIDSPATGTAWVRPAGAFTVDVTNGVSIPVDGQLGYAALHRPMYGLAIRGGYAFRLGRRLDLAPELGFDFDALRPSEGGGGPYVYTRPEGPNFRLRALWGVRLSVHAGRIEWLLRLVAGYGRTEESFHELYVAANPPGTESYEQWRANTLAVVPETGLLVRVWRLLHLGANVGVAWDAASDNLFVGTRLDVRVGVTLALRPYSAGAP